MSTCPVAGKECQRHYNYNKLVLTPEVAPVESNHIKNFMYFLLKAEFYFSQLQPILPIHLLWH